MEKGVELRNLAEWMRGWAEVASHTDRPWHAGFTEYLERRPEQSRRACPALERLAAIH
jgi:hypothetical protein